MDVAKVCRHISSDFDQVVQIFLKNVVDGGGGGGGGGGWKEFSGLA
jgi:hypothetical protein